MTGAELTGTIMGCAMKVPRMLGICRAHEAQRVNDLTATRHDTGLLLNFGSSSLQYKKKFRVYKKPDSNPENPE